MKILKLNFKNLNSLQDKIEIDFTKFGDSIFAITGETGSGKTTILDAICVSLYGQTPRLKNVKELVSKNKADAYSEVTFEVKGIIYRSYWSIRRARNNIEGNFQSAKRELYKEDKLITAKVKEVSKKIEEITNLNFKNFTKSLLLAQGSFDAFLKAKESEKSEILQKMTGTEIYRKISAKVFEKTRRREAKIDDIIKEINLLDLLDNEKRVELEDSKEKIAKDINIIDNQIEIYTKKESIKLDLENRNRDKRELEQFIKENHLNIEILQKKYSLEDEKYKDFIVFYKDEKQKISHAQKIELEIENFKKDEQRFENELKKDQKDFNNSQKERLNNENKLKKLNLKKDEDTLFLESNKYVEKLIKNESLIKDIIINIKNQKKIKEDKLKIIKDYKITDETVKDITSTIENIEKEKDIIDNDIKILGDEEFLIQKLDNTEKILKDIEDYKIVVKNIKNIKENQKEKRDKVKELKLKQENTQKLLDLIKQHLKDLLSQKNREIKIKKYEEDRKLLKKGEKCSLCGSINHPYIEHYPNIDMKIESKISKKEKEREKYISKDKTLFKDIGIIEESLDRLEKELIDLNSRLKTYISLEIDKKDNEFLNIYKEELILKIKKLKNLKKDREKKLNLLIEKNIQKDILNIAHEIEILEKKLKLLIEDIQIDDRNKLDSIQIEITNLINRYQNSIESRENIFKDIEKLKNAIIILNIETTRLDNNIKEQKSQIDIIKNKIDTLTTKREKIIQEKDLKNYQIKLEYKEQEFKDKLQNIQSNISQKKAIEEIKTNSLDKLKKDIEDIYKKLIEVDIQFENLNIDISLSDLKVKRDELNQELGRNSEKLIQDEKKQKKNIKLISQKEKLEEDYKIWSTLNELIGSATGEKFEKFALNQTLGYLCELANKHLRKLNKRYTLIPSNNIKDLLTLHIMDRYQANIIRPISTLSGGESFLVSLALSLGLSDLVSNKIEIRSIFLDEGFGTLDEENLDMVISTLESLQIDGKIIGIISHVENLKSRITNQIIIKKKGDGSSSININYD